MLKKLVRGDDCANVEPGSQAEADLKALGFIEEDQVPAPVFDEAEKPSRFRAAKKK